MKNPYKLMIALVASIFLSSCASTEKVKIRFHTTAGAAPNIYIDGKLIGAADFNALTIDLTPGEHQIRAVSPEWETVEITIHVKPKGEASVQSTDNSAVQQTFRIDQKKKE
jgi:hypothetical protein